MSTASIKEEESKPSRMLLRAGLPITIFHTQFTLAEDTWVEGDLHLALLNGFGEGGFFAGQEEPA